MASSVSTVEGPLSMLARSILDNTSILIKTDIGRTVIGRIVAYDRYYNILLKRARETLTITTNGHIDIQHKYLGTILIEYGPVSVLPHALLTP